MSKKVRKSRSSSLVALFLTLILSLSLTGCVRATPVEGKVEVPPFTILIDGKQYTEANFAELPVYECTASSTNNYGTEETYVYTGYQLEDVLNTVGAPVTTGLTAVGSDGYESDFTAKETQADTTLLAFWRDGKPSAEEGTVSIAPCKSDESPDYVKVVTEINTKEAA